MTTDIKTYIKKKVKILKQFCVDLNTEQIKHIMSLKTEGEVDAYAHDLIKEKLHGIL